MDELIDKLISINDVIHTLGNNEQKLVLEQANIMNQMLDDILTQIEAYKYLKNPCASSKDQYTKDKLIANTLFPIYWYLSENIDLIDNETEKI